MKGSALEAVCEGKKGEAARAGVAEGEGQAPDPWLEGCGYNSARLRRLQVRGGPHLLCANGSPL